MRSLLLSALLLASAFQTAMGQIVEGQWTYIVEDGGATITASTATGAVTIPSVLGGYAVKKVGKTWIPILRTYTPIFGHDNTSVTSVVIPNSVTSIGHSAFYGCYSLTSVSIPNSVTSIDFLAFCACYGLTSILIPNSVTSIGGSAFAVCRGLTSITIPNSVTSIGESAFASCISLTSIIIPNSVTSIENNLFNSCLSLTSITIPNSVTSIGERAFGYCTSLTSITIPNSVTSIGDSAFAPASMLQRVFLPVRFGTTYQNFGLTASQVILYDPSNLDPAPIYLAGQQSVIANPNTYNLYTTSQIQNMLIGDLVLTKNVGGGFTLNYEIEQSTDLQTWTTYAPLSLRLDGLPTDKAFVRIQIKTTDSTPFPPPVPPLAPPL